MTFTEATSHPNIELKPSRMEREDFSLSLTMVHPALAPVPLVPERPQSPSVNHGPQRDGWGTSAGAMRWGWDVGRECGRGHGALSGAGSSFLSRRSGGSGFPGSPVVSFSPQKVDLVERGWLGKLRFAMLDFGLRGVLLTYSSSLPCLVIDS